jgi:hypothetical protein
LDLQKKQSYPLAISNRSNIDATRNRLREKDSDPYSDGMGTRYILSMNTRQVVAVRTVDAKPPHSDGVKTRSTGKIILSRDMDYCVVRTDVGCGTEIQMERSISGGLLRRQ